MRKTHHPAHEHFDNVHFLVLPIVVRLGVSGQAARMSAKAILRQLQRLSRIGTLEKTKTHSEELDLGVRLALSSLGIAPGFPPGILGFTKKIIFRVVQDVIPNAFTRAACVEIM